MELINTTSELQLYDLIKNNDYRKTLLTCNTILEESNKYNRAFIRTVQFVKLDSLTMLLNKNDANNIFETVILYKNLTSYENFVISRYFLYICNTLNLATMYLHYVKRPKELQENVEYSIFKLDLELRTSKYNKATSTCRYLLRANEEVLLACVVLEKIFSITFNYYSRLSIRQRISKLELIDNNKEEVKKIRKLLSLKKSLYAYYRAKEASKIFPY